MEASLAPDGQCERTGNIRLGHPLPFTLFTPRDDISEGLFFCSLVQYNSLYDTAFVFCKLETRNVRMLGNKRWSVEDEVRSFSRRKDSLVVW